ncbi:MAG: hypothetical protein ACAI25_11415 [Planctomycetota bacterium]
MDPCLGYSIGLFGLWATWFVRGILARGPDLTRSEAPQRFLEALERALELEADDGLIEGVVYPGGRRVTARVVVEPEPAVVFTVEIGKGPRMRLSRESAGTWVKKTFGNYDEPQIGDQRFDDTVFIESDDGEKPKVAKHLAKGRELRKRILEAFEEFSIRSLEIKKGFLEARAPVAALRRMKQYPRLLRLLVKTARAYDRVNIRVKVLGRDLFAISGTTGRARCAYCHDTVTGEEPDLVACEVCGTILHSDCYGELGFCPMLGCPGTRPERAPTREGS